MTRPAAAARAARLPALPWGELAALTLGFVLLAAAG
jgi:hypothetical protein